jgi:hypothetical protein
MKTSQVFISHTAEIARFPDGRSFVQAALDAIARAEMAPVDMRYFPANDTAPDNYCRSRVRGCEIYIAIVGFRYGSIVPGQAVSYTEMEFQEAGATGIPRLVFLLEESACPNCPADADRSLISAFRQRLCNSGLLVRNFTSAVDLELEIFHALSKLSTGRQPTAYALPALPGRILTRLMHSTRRAGGHIARRRPAHHHAVS